MNVKYSLKDLHGQVFIGEPAEDFDGDIVGTCFEQVEPNTEVFPADATGSLLRCNVNNCAIPVGMTVGATQGVGSCNLHHAKQNDLERWVVDKDTLEPIEPLYKDMFIDLGISVDPADISLTPLLESIIITKRKERGEL